MPEFSIETLSVATPCSAVWESMTGDHQKRFCQQCQLNVYNLSGMTRDAAEALIADSEGAVHPVFPTGRWHLADPGLPGRAENVAPKTVHEKVRENSGGGQHDDRCWTVLCATRIGN